MCFHDSLGPRAGRLAQQSSTWVDLESCLTYCAEKVVPVEGDKGAAGVAIETTVANCSRPSEPSTAVSCAVGGAAVASRRLAKPDTAWVAVKSRGAPGSCVADDPPKRRSGRPGECRQRPCRRPRRPSQAASLCMWSYCVLV